MYRPLSVTALVLLAATACSSAPTARIQPLDGVISGQCHTDRVIGATGLAASPGTVERARVDSDSLQVQVVRGDADTAAARTASSSGGERLTIEIGRTNNITGLHCG